MNMHYTKKSPWSKEEILVYLKNHLKESRLHHILGVVKAAKELAADYGEDLNKAELAALYHDILKDKDKKWLVSYIKSHGEEPAEGLLAWKTLHAPAGAIFAKEVCGQANEEILNAVRFHTTGRVNMTLLEKIIFVADYIEEGRNFNGVDDLRTLARLDLDQAVLASLENSIRHLRKMNEHVMSSSLEAATYYKELITRKDSK